ncbi:MAG TPA: endo-1,4-beta-xylanase [Rariglobus sp.]
MNTLITKEYRKLWSDPALQSRIDEGIRLHRQSDAVIRATDYSGKPLAGVKIKVIQHDSPFHFGANIFKLDDYPLDELNRKYEQSFLALFSGATVPFYWRTLEPVQGRPRFAAHSVPITRRPPPDTVVAFCEKHGLRMHGHTLVWNLRSWSIPDWLPENPADADQFWEKRIKEIAARYGAHIKRWDVLNEAAAFYARQPRGLPMSEDYEGKSFAWAEKYLPADARLDINETTDAWNLGNRDYTQLIRRLLDSNARIGAVGLQFHLFSDAELKKVLSGETFQPARLFAALDHYAVFGLPLHVSEITLTAPGNTVEGLAAQAEVARNFYRLWFSHPSVEGITWWNLPDGGAAQGEDKVYSGLTFDDMRPKPAYRALHDLIRREWRTTAQGVTDGDGFFRFRGFHGTYRVQTDSGKADAGIETAIILEPGKTAQQLVRL